MIIFVIKLFSQLTFYFSWINTKCIIKCDREYKAVKLTESENIYEKLKRKRIRKKKEPLIDIKGPHTFEYVNI